MEKQTFTRLEVISILEDLLQMSDLVIDALCNENTNNGATELLEIVERDRKELSSQLDDRGSSCLSCGSSIRNCIC